MRSRPTISTYVCGSLVAIGLLLIFFRHAIRSVSTVLMGRLHCDHCGLALERCSRGLWSSSWSCRHCTACITEIRVLVSGPSTKTRGFQQWRVRDRLREKPDPTPRCANDLRRLDSLDAHQSTLMYVIPTSSQLYYIILCLLSRGVILT